jgi:hypothetical protein
LIENIGEFTSLFVLTVDEAVLIPLGTGKIGVELSRRSKTGLGFS